MKKKLPLSNILSLLLIIVCSINIQAQIIANGTYQIFNSVHNEVMTCANTSPYDANMTVPNSSDNYQLWTFTHQANDIYKIVNAGNGNNLGINDGWCGNFGDVKANFNTTDSNVEFKIQATPVVGKYTIEIAFTTCNFGSVNSPVKAFDIQDGLAGAQIQTYEKDNTNANQQFSIVDPTLSSNDFASSENNFNVFVDNFKNLNIQNYTNSDFSISIYEMNGKLINDSKHDNSTLVKKDLSSLSKGVYIINILEKDNTKTIKKIVLF